MRNVFSHPYQLDESMSNIKVVVQYCIIFIQFLKKLLLSNSGEPDKTPRFLASGLVLHCLTMSHKKDASLIRVSNLAFLALRVKYEIVFQLRFAH